MQFAEPGAEPDEGGAQGAIAWSLAEEIVRARRDHEQGRRPADPLSDMRETGALYRSLTAIANRVLSLFGRAEGRYRSLPLAGGWTRFRDFPAPPSGGTFHAQWKAARKQP